MIIIIEGVPGTGKTYWAVDYISKRFFYFDKEMSMYFPRSSHFRVISNIESLKLEAVEYLDSYLSDSSVSSFFTVESIKERFQSQPVLFVIDEAQEYFPLSLRDDNIFRLFNYHRHLGLDFILICPDADKMSRHVSKLAEYHVVARHTTFNFAARFRYKYLSGGVPYQAITLKKDNRVFRIYKSFQSLSKQKSHSPIARYALIMVLLLLFIVLGVRYLFIPSMMHVPSSFSSGSSPSSPSSPSGSSHLSSLSSSGPSHSLSVSPSFSSSVFNRSSPPAGDFVGSLRDGSKVYSVYESPKHFSISVLNNGIESVKRYRKSEPVPDISSPDDVVLGSPAPGPAHNNITDYIDNRADAEGH